MDYVKHDMGNYNLYFIKTKKFKTITISLNFRKEITPEDEVYSILLKNVLMYATNRYHNLDDLCRASMEVYDPNVKIEAVYDEPNEKHLLKIHRFKHGNYKTTTLSPEFVLSEDYKKLQESAHALQGVIGDGAVISRAKANNPIKNFDEAVNWLIKQAEKGIILQRYKGLGEMTPKQLKETTMDPKVRRMLKVRIEDAASADAIFSMLMGDVVEPRREFIELNARFVSNIDA